MIFNRTRASLMVVTAFFVRSVISTSDDDKYVVIGSGFHIEKTGMNTIVNDKKYKPLNTENIGTRKNDNKDGEISSLSPLEDELQPNNERSRRSSISSSSDPTDDKAIIKRQKASLMRMGCRPRRRKVYLRQALESHDIRKDALKLIPAVVAVKECDPKCSYCSQNAFGFEKPGKVDRYYKCAATKKVMKNFTVKAIMQGSYEYFKLPLEYHKSCECKKVESKVVRVQKS